jgi:hypothetical protein
MSFGAGGRPAVAAAVLALTAAATIRQFAQPAPADYFAPDQPVYLAMVQTPFADTPMARSLRSRRRRDHGTRALTRLLRRAFTSFALLRIAAIGLLRRLAVSWTSATVCGTRHITH